MAYTFSTNLLSAQKTGSPNLIGTSLSGVGVTFLSGSNVAFATQQVIVVSLSTNDAGIAFSPVEVAVSANQLSSFKLSAYQPLVSVNVEGSQFLIPSLLNTSNFAVIKINSGNFTVFPWLSSTTIVATSALEATRDVGTPNTRRLWVLGYI